VLGCIDAILAVTAMQGLPTRVRENAGEFFRESRGAVMTEHTQEGARGGRTIDIEGTSLWVREAGAEGPTAIFSHGLFLTHHLFDAPVAALARTCRCVAYDHRGQGSSPAGGIRYAIDVERVYQDAVVLIESLKAAPCHWVGQSLGSYVGMRLAARRPDLLRSLVLLAPRVRANPHWFVVQVEILCQVVRAAHAMGRVGYAFRRALATYAMRELLGPTFMSDAGRAHDREAFRSDLIARLTPAMIPAIRGTIRYPENWPAMLGRIHAPTLIIAGDEDRTYELGVQHAREVQAAIPNSKVITVAGAGHALLVEQPATVTGAIVDFLGKIGRP
jgi:3-oxoadipate enol-lactonase